MRHISQITQNVEAIRESAGGGFLSDGRPLVRSGDSRYVYNNRPTLDQLDTAHPGVRRAVDAVYLWRNRYNAACDPFIEDTPRAPSLVLSGPNGTGKTHIARAIQWSRVSCPVGEDGEPMLSMARPAGRWFDAADLILKLAPTQTEYRTVEYASVGSLIGAAPFAVVDDLGGEGVIPFVGVDYQTFERQSRWFRFIDFCYDRGVPLIVTTNLSIQNGELAEWIGRRAWDRLNEMSPVGQMVGMWDVPSWRVQAGGR